MGDEEEKSVKEKKEKSKSQKIKEDSDEEIEKSEVENMPNSEKPKPKSKKEKSSVKIRIGPKSAKLHREEAKEEEKVQKSAKETVLATSSEDNDSDDIFSDTEEEESAQKLRKTFDQLIEKIDIKTDSKLHKSNIAVVVEKLDLQLDDNNSVTLPDSTKEKKKIKEKSEGAKFDAEISKLCDLGALNKLTKTKSKGSKKLTTLDNGKMKNGGRKKSSKEATKDSDVEELTSGSDIETKPVGKAGKETSSAKDRAKEIVLETSESDMSDAEIKKKSSKKDAKRNGNSKPDKKQRKSRKDPDFMKVKLDVTDSDEQEEKSKRRREKAKKKVLEESDDDDIEEESPSKKSGRKAKKIASSDFEDEMGSENESEDKMEEDKSEDL